MGQNIFEFSYKDSGFYLLVGKGCCHLKWFSMNESSEMFKDYTEILLSLLHQLIAAMNMQIIHLPVILKSLLTILVKIYA